MNTLLGTKAGMTQIFVNGVRTPVTEVVTGPCVVTQVKTIDKDGYNSVQLGFGNKSIKTMSKPLIGHLKGATKDKKAPLFLAEVELADTDSLKQGDSIMTNDVFSEGDIVTVSGISKGKGFAGVVKRWGFSGASPSHGQKGVLRRPGSIGQGTTPGRVRKGKKMSGRMGNERVTVTNLKVIKIADNKNSIFVSGSVPGPRGRFLTVKVTKKSEIAPVETNSDQ